MGEYFFLGRGDMHRGSATKRATQAENCSLVLSDNPSATMKVCCTATDSLVRTIATCVENNLALWKLENEGCTLTASQRVTNEAGEGLRVDALSLGSFQSAPLIACGHNDFSLQVFRQTEESDGLTLEWQQSHAHSDYVNDCAFLYSNSGQSSLVSCSEDQTIRVWDLETSEIAMEYHTRSTPISITTHKDMPNQFWVAEEDGTIKLYDKVSSMPLCTLASPSHLPLSQISWNNQSSDLIGAVDRGKWYVWNWREGKMIASGRSMCESGATGFQWSFSHQNLFTVYSHSEILLWDMNHLGIGCQQLQPPAQVQDVTWMGDEACTVFASGGSLTFWRTTA